MTFLPPKISSDLIAALEQICQSAQVSLIDADINVKTKTFVIELQTTASWKTSSPSSRNFRKTFKEAVFKLLANTEFSEYSVRLLTTVVPPLVPRLETTANWDNSERCYLLSLQAAEFFVCWRTQNGDTWLDHLNKPVSKKALAALAIELIGGPQDGLVVKQ